MNERQFFDWQTLGGGNDVEKLVQILNSTGAKWCMIGGLAVNHWAVEPLATADVDIVISSTDVERCVAELVRNGFKAERFDWSINLAGQSKVSIQISVDAMYADFPVTSVVANVHGIRMPVASLENTLLGKLAAYSDPKRRGSKKQKDFLDIVRLVESHPKLIEQIPLPIRDNIESSLG